MSYEDIIKYDKIKNWLKGSFALRITKEGLRDLVDGDSMSIQQNIYFSVLQARNLSPGTTCCHCLTETLFPCFTKGLCSHPRNCKIHGTPVKSHRPCPLLICDDVRDKIYRLHRFKGPSWKNSHADQWCVNHWEIAKCFMPPDGYKNVCSFAETDYNGVISILINCTAFQQKLSFKVGTEPNILTQARNIGQIIRHSPDQKVTDADLKGMITTLTTLLSDPKYLSGDRKAKEAVLKLNQLQTDTLIISNEDVYQILDEARIVVETGKHQIKHATGSGTRKLESSVREGVREIYSRTTEGIEVIEKAVVEAIENIRTSTTEREKVIKRSLSSALSLLCLASSLSGSSTVSGRLKCDLQIRLAKNYQKTLSSAPISPLVSDKDEMLDKFYVAPRIMEKDRRKIESSEEQKGTLISSYRNIFCKGDALLSNIYIIGEAGMGKSTFTTKCALVWGKQILDTDTLDSSSKHEFQDVEVLAKFDFLFHVTLRNSNESCNLTDMITDQIISRIYLGDEEAAGRDTLLSVLSNRKCLILADGLDEWSHPHDTKCFCREEEKVVPFLSSTIDATVLITSRPWRMAQHRVKDSRIDKYLEIEGAADTKHLVQNVLGCLCGKTESEEKSREFLSFIDKRKLPNLLSVPIVLMMLVCLWFEGVGESFSLCEIYALMIDMMFGRKALTKYKPQHEQTKLPSCFQNSKHIFRNIPALLSSAKLAFEQLFSMDKKSALVFKQVGSLSQEDLEIMQKTGIIRETKSQSFIMQSSSYSFIHKTVQEFLAALHLSYNPHEFHRVVEPFYNQAVEISDVSEVFIYICGMNSHIANQMSTMMCNTVPLCQTGVISSSNYIYTIDRPKYSVVDILQRLIARGHIEACANNVANIQLSLHFFIFDQRTRNVSTLKTLLSMNACQVRYMCIKRHEKVISENEIEKVLSLSKDTLSALDMENRGGLIDMSTCRQLKHLRLSGKGIRNISMNAECLVSCKLFRLSIEVEKAVLHSLNSNEFKLGIANRCSPLKHIEMNSIKNVDLFCETLPLLSQLKYLHINETNLCDHILHLPGTVTCVELLKVTMTSNAFQGLVKKLEESTHTVTCFLYSCTVKPNSEFENTKQYVRSCLKYTVLVDDIDIFSFKRSI
ncbi:uncharacterized protein LOC128208716 [Mya arenaria]|uniref:uncharacterized protein LOC128208716 n=1 Tax=Mya arenaria TaxID=6604 RepID=UPI0022E414CE|nr:uncharacterized protein LOC128208716 [Mya arenaria]